MHREGAFPFVADRRRGRRVFCFHHAGGSAAAYRGWVGQNPRVDIVPVELPGKGTRSQEPWVEDFDTLARRCAEEILEVTNGTSCVLYGHSMGAALAYQTAAHLQEMHGHAPDAVVVAARHAPGDSVVGEYHSSSGWNVLREELKSVGGTPSEILEDDDMMAHLLPVIWRDYVLHEDFHHSTTVLSCPVLAMAGTGDRSATPEMVARWSAYTKDRFVLTVRSGGHFFPLEDGPAFLEDLADGLDEVIRHPS